MENNKEKEYYTIDLILVMKSIWKKMWLIILVGILTAAVGFSIASYVIPPTYASSATFYVNNSSVSLGDSGIKISASDITAAQNLVKTYGEILKSRTILEKVIEETGLPYTPEKLAKMIVAKPSNNTEIMKVTVTTLDPEESAKIANCIADILPGRIAEITKGGTMGVVDYAVPNLQKVAPNITQYTALGMLAGMLIVIISVVISAMTDDTIHDEEYVLQNYDCPILAKIPNLFSSGGKKYGGYYRKRSSGKKANN